jgi:hypothetical protein
MRTSKKPIVDNEIVRRIISTMKSNGVRQKDLMENIGVASQVFASWKYDNGKSYMNYIDKLEFPGRLLTASIFPVISFSYQQTQEP